MPSPVNDKKLMIDKIRIKPSKHDFINTWIVLHKKISGDLYDNFKNIFIYDDEFYMLMAFKEIEYLVFWFLRQKLNDSILIEIHNKFLDGSKMSYDSFREQLELRYKIYDNAYGKFINEPNSENASKHGLAIGQILMKSIGDLDLLKNEQLKDENSQDVATLFKAFNIWFEGIKFVDDVIKSMKCKFEIESFLRGT